MIVSSQPRLICVRSPADAHHLRSTQPRAMGRKVSDEFTVPLCRTHHRDNHNFGDEVAWWEIEFERLILQNSLQPGNSGVKGRQSLDLAGRAAAHESVIMVNASLSIGPRTLGRKLRSSRNAFRHGLATSVINHTAPSIDRFISAERTHRLDAKSGRRKPDARLKGRMLRIDGRGRGSRRPSRTCADSK